MLVKTLSLLYFYHPTTFCVNVKFYTKSTWTNLSHLQWKEVATVATQKKSLEKAAEEARQHLVKIVDDELEAQIDVAKALGHEAAMERAICQIALHAAKVHCSNLERLRDSLISGCEPYTRSVVMVSTEDVDLTDFTLDVVRSCIEAVNERYAGRIPPIALVHDNSAHDRTTFRRADAAIRFLNEPSV